MASSSRVLSVCMLAVCLLVLVDGHGRLWEPPARTTAWRHTGRFSGAPVEYDDNQLYCGGRQVQWNQNNGQCGVCGDNIKDAVKKHELGLGPGSLVKSILIVGTYTTGQVIDVTVEITANHEGYFEFRLCVRDDHSTTKLTHECLDQNLLRDVRTNKTRRDIGTSTGRLVTSLQLPSGVTCKECVLQWKYNTGKDWGICPDGVGRRGCSDKPEQFYGCADISITQEGDSSEEKNSNSGAGSNGNGNGGARSNGNGNGGMLPAGNDNNGKDGDTTTSPTTSTSTSPTTSTTESTTTTRSNGNGESRSNGCRPAVLYASVPGMRNWCLVNCLSGYCPISHCRPECRRIPEAVSSGDCQPTLTYRSQPGMTDWCLNNCPSNCPRTHCNDACREP